MDNTSGNSHAKNFAIVVAACAMGGLVATFYAFMATLVFFHYGKEAYATFLNTTSIATSGIFFVGVVVYFLVRIEKIPSDVIRKDS